MDIVFFTVLYLVLCFIAESNFIGLSSKHTFHTDFVPAFGDNKGLKVLVIAVDNRHLHDEIAASKGYGGIVAVLQHNYCKHHGYDYIRMVNDKTNLVKEVREKYAGVTQEIFQKDVLDTTDSPKHGFDVLHPGYLRARSSSWGKLPALWHVAEKYGHRYDYIWFMDSDAVPNPMQKDRSLGDALEGWSRNTTESVQWGKVAPSNVTFLFMSNFPYRDDLPCAGTIIFKPTKLAQDALREWWDFDLVYKARDDFMEQDALWYLLEAAGAQNNFNFLINEHTTVALNEQQFSSAWRGYSDIWFAHIPSGEEYRVGYFRTMLSIISVRTQEQFQPLIEDIKKHCVYIVPFLNITERMEALHERPYRTNRPPENKIRSVDNVWHAVRNIEARPPPPPVGSLYNGFAVHMDGDQNVYLVYNNERHVFQNEESMTKMGFDHDSVLVFRYNKNHPVPHRIMDNIPLGEKVPLEGITVRITPTYELHPIK